MDFLETAIFSTKSWSISESENLTSKSYKESLESNVVDLINLGKPVFLSVGIQSRKNALTDPGYLEETVCNGGLNDPLSQSNQCVQKETVTDFGLQATVIQGEMEYVKSLNQKNVIVFVSDYFATDSLYPQTAFPNIGFTIRNKPAEGLVREWFRR